MLGWISIIETLTKTYKDLHIKSAGDGPSFLELARAWILSPDGHNVLNDIDALLQQFDIPLIVSIRRK